MFIKNKVKEAIAHSIIYGLGSLIQSLSGFFLLPLLTKTLSKSEFGAYSLILIAASVASAIFYLGITSAMPRSYFDYSKEEDRRSVYTTAFLILAFGAILQILFGYFGGEYIAEILLHNTAYKNAIGWAFFSGALTSINLYFYTYLRLIRKSISSVSFGIIGLIFGVGLTFYLLKEQPDHVKAPFESMAYSQLIISTIFLLIFFKRAFVWKFNVKEIKPLLHFGLAAVVASFASILIDWSDRIIMQQYMTLADVGIYSAIGRVASLVGIALVIPFSQIWSPMMMEYRNNKNIKELFSLVFSYFFIAGSVILSTAAAFSLEILSFFVKYNITPILLIVYLLTIVANLIYGSLNILVAGFFYERKIYSMALIYYLASFLKIILNLVFVPFFGIGAAACSNLLIAIITPFAMYEFAKKYFSFRIEWGRLVKLIMALCPIFIFSVFSMSITNKQTHFSLASIFLLLTFLFILKFCLSRKERDALKVLINKTFTFIQLMSHKNKVKEV
jgi:O-antigen/teichoic acid export membrane protein